MIIFYLNLGSGKTSIVETILGRKSPTLKDEGDMAVMNNNFKHIVVQKGPLIPWTDVILSETVFLVRRLIFITSESTGASYSKICSCSVFQ